MVQLLKSPSGTFQRNTLKFIKPEMPLFTFNRICFGLIHNDWVLVISSLFTLAVSVGSFVLGSGR